MRRTLALLAGSFAVYALAAACGGGAGSGIVAAVLSPDAAPEAALPGAEGGAGGGALEASVAQLDAATVAEAEATAQGTSGSAVGGDAGGRDALAVPEAHAEPQTSGTRLKARWLVGDDGSRQFEGWWDSKLEIDCVFTDGGDGKRYCLPTTQSSQAGRTASEKLAVWLPYVTCAKRFVVFTTLTTPKCGPAVNTAAVYLARDVTESDPVVRGTSSGGGVWFVTGDPVPLSTFVSASVVTDP